MADFTQCKAELTCTLNDCQSVKGGGVISSLARFKQPKRIVIINKLGDMPELPKGPTKKILHRELRDYYQRRLVNSEYSADLNWVSGTQ